MNPSLVISWRKKDSKKKGKNPQSAPFIGKKSKIEKPITTARNNIETGFFTYHGFLTIMSSSNFISLDLQKNNGYK
jgi:hypothetical protein